MAFSFEDVLAAKYSPYEEVRRAALAKLGGADIANVGWSPGTVPYAVPTEGGVPTGVGAIPRTTPTETPTESFPWGAGGQPVAQKPTTEQYLAEYPEKAWDVMMRERGISEFTPYGRWLQSQAGSYYYPWLLTQTHPGALTTPFYQALRGGWGTPDIRGLYQQMAGMSPTSDIGAYWQSRAQQTFNAAITALRGRVAEPIRRFLADRYEALYDLYSSEPTEESWASWLGRRFGLTGG